MRRKSASLASDSRPANDLLMIYSTPYSIPREPGRWRAITLALLVHAALLAFLWIGVRWQNHTPVAVEAEIWDPVTEQAAPMAAPLPVEKTAEEPQVKPEPAPEPTPAAKLLPKPEVTPLPLAKPDIALAQEKKRKALKEQQERLEDELRQKKALKQKAEQERLAEERHQEKLLKQKEEQERLKKQKIADEKLAEKAKEKEKTDALARKKREAEDAKKAAADQKRKQDAADDAKLAKMRDENMRQLTGATGSGANNSTGTAAKSQGSSRDAGYEQKIGAKIKSNTVFNVPDDLAGNPNVLYEIQLYPDGSVKEIQLKKPSGVPGFDEAVKRGIRKSEPFPADKSGKVPSSIPLSYKPKDQ